MSNRVKELAATLVTISEIGDEYRDHRDVGKTELLEGDRIILHPGAAVIIETAEFVHFPRTRFGHIVPRVSLLQVGISNTSSKIDPGYHGKLLITVFNLGKKKVELKKGTPFCTLYVLEIADGVRVYERDPKRIVGGPKRGFFRSLRDYIETNQTYFTIILTISTIALVIATFVLTVILIRASKAAQ
jgi:dCTP deaminase